MRREQYKTTRENHDQLYVRLPQPHLICGVRLQLEEHLTELLLVLQYFVVAQFSWELTVIADCVFVHRGTLTLCG